MSGDRGLLAAVLLRGLDDSRKGRTDAAVWIDSDREDGPTTFLKICEYLDLSPEEVRKAARNGAGRRR
jgi:hypothetical protein